jgi:hypothetical protein
MFSDAGMLLEIATQSADVSIAQRVVAVFVLCLSVIGSWGVFSGVRRRSP